MYNKAYTWSIEKSNDDGNYIKVGEFTGTTEGFNLVKRAIEIYVDTEEGCFTSFCYTVFKEGKNLIAYI